MLKLKLALSVVFLFLSNFHSFAQSEKAKYPFFEGEFLVQLDQKNDIRSVLSQFPASYKLELKNEVSAPMRVWLVSFNKEAVSHEQLKRELFSLSQVSLVDYNYKVFLRATDPDDVQYSQQWHHKNTGQTGGTVDADIDSDEAWDITTGGTAATGEDIVVCIMESANLTHTDLVDNRWVNEAEIPDNNIDDDGNGYVDDYYGWDVTTNSDAVGTGAHGTNCAGMIGATGNNSSGVSGVNWNVKMMVVSGYNVNSQANIISIYTYPLKMRQRWNNTNGTEGAFVVATSASWGVDNGDPTDFPLWCSMYDTLGKYGILNVGATTNNNSNVDVNGDVPTACSSPYMIGVGRTDHNDATAGGYGVTHVDFGAPGINVRTTANTNSYTTTTGTSFACPLTAGAIALAYSIPCSAFMNLVKDDPQTGANLVLDALLSGVDVKANLASKFVTSGRLNVKNTLDLLMTNACDGSICLAPANIATSSVVSDAATISWDSFSQATEYTFNYREMGANTWISSTETGTTKQLSGLDSCTFYEYQIKSNCGTEASNFSSVRTFRTTGCGSCIELSYCASKGTNSSDEWIAKVKFNDTEFVSGNDGGYGDHTNATGFDFYLGYTNSFEITPGYASSAYSEYSRIWIDLNQNGAFENDEKVFDQSAAATGQVSSTFIIPATASLGSTRMRIQMAYQGTGQNTLPQVCGNYTYGEVEDFCVNIESNAGVAGLLENTALIYPNPSQGKFSIQVLNSELKTINVYNLQGKLIQSISVLNTSVELDLSQQASGMFICQFLSEKGSVLSSKKITIQP